MESPHIRFHRLVFLIAPGAFGYMTGVDPSSAEANLCRWASLVSHKIGPNCLGDPPSWAIYAIIALMMLAVVAWTFWPAVLAVVANWRLRWPIARRNTTASQALLSVGRCAVDFSALERERFLKITCFCFNAAETQFRIGNPTGTILYLLDGVEVSGEGKIDPPVLDPDFPNLIEPNSKNSDGTSLVVLKQYLPSDLSRQIASGFTDGHVLTLSLANVEVRLSSDKITTRMPLWSGINCIKGPGTIGFGRQNSVSIVETLSPSAKVTIR